jgi:hypothetical protein
VKTKDPLSGPTAPGLIQLDDKTLISVRLTRCGDSPQQFRAVAIAAVQARRRVSLSSPQTVGFGPNPEAALEACLGRVRASLRKAKPRRLERRPDATL